VRTQTKIIRVFILIVSFVTMGARADFDKDLRFWNEFMWRQYSGDRWHTYTWGELRWVDDISQLGTKLVQQKVIYKARPDLSFGAGFAWIEIQNTDDSWNRMSRMELELTPRWTVSDSSFITLRNRLETRWWESRSDRTEFVSRHRLRYARSANWFGSMERYEFSNELFWDFSGEGFNENRLRPITLVFKAGNDGLYNTFFQIRSRKLSSDNHWEHAYILGLGIRLK
jgi:hypothetical protein